MKVSQRWFDEKDRSTLLDGIGRVDRSIAQAYGGGSGRWEEKLEIVAESLAAGAVVSEVA